MISTKALTVALGNQGDESLAYDPGETFLTDSQVEQRWNVAPGYMSELRAQGVGPPHVRLSPRIIRYKQSAIGAYEQTQEFASNAAAIEAAKSEAVIEAPAVRSARSRSQPPDRRRSGRGKSPPSRELETA
jgi:hypothetical protein